MSGMELLQYSNSNTLDPFFRKAVMRGPTDSIFTPQGWRTYTNEAHRRRLIPPINGFGYNSQSFFQYDKSCWLRGPVQAVYSRSSVAIPNNGTFARFVDYEGLASIARIDWYYGANLLHTLSTDALLLYHLQFKNWKMGAMEDELVLGGKSQSERVFLASTAQTLTVDLPLPYTLTPAVYFFSSMVATNLQVNITWAPLANITQTDSTTIVPVVTMTACNLLSFDVHVMGDERNSGQTLGLTQQGITYRVLEWEAVTRVPLTAGQSSYTINLTTLKGASAELLFVIRNQSALTPALPSKGLTLTDFQPLLNWTVIAGGIVVFDNYVDQYTRFYLQPMFHSSIGGAYIYGANFSYSPESLVDSMGHKTWASMNVPQLTLQFGTVTGGAANLANNAFVDIFSRSNNLINLNGGEVKRIFQ